MKLIKRAWCRLFGHRTSHMKLLFASVRGHFECDRCGEKVSMDEVEWA